MAPSPKYFIRFHNESERARLMEEKKDDKIRDREIVVPGELLSSDIDMMAGRGTIKRNGNIYANHLGIKSVRSNYVNVIALRGKYIPQKGDVVIGTVVDIGHLTWTIDIGAIEPVSLHVNNVPWRVDYGDTKRFLNIGNTVLLKIISVDSLNNVEPSLKGTGLRRLTDGFLLQISSSKVPRVIGKGGSMISLIRSETNCRLFVGQNGRIWVEGSMEMIPRVSTVIEMIETYAHEIGLTERVKAYLNGFD